MNGSKNIKAGSVIKGYFGFIIISGAVLAAGVVSSLIFPEMWKFIIGGIFVAYVIAAILIITINNRELSCNLLIFARNYETLESRVIDRFPLPYAIVDKTGNIIAYNKRFEKVCGSHNTKNNICELFDSVNFAGFNFRDGEENLSIEFNNRTWRLTFSKVNIEPKLLENMAVNVEHIGSYVMALYMHDETEVVKLMRHIVEEKTVICSLTIDDYEDVFERVDDIRKSMILAQIDKEIADYFSKIGGLVRKTDKDNYFVVFKNRSLANLRSNKFDILDRIRAIYNDRDIPVTASIGVGVGDDYEESQTYAKSALELALGRGGDQVVVKEGERLYFYGGKTKSSEKNSRVHVRVNALAIRDIIKSHEQVVIMGHKIGDMDCFGSAIGIAKLAKSLGKKAYIVLNELNNTVHPILGDFLDSPDYGDETFLSAQEAPKCVTPDTVLVITDVNRPEIFEIPELIHKTKAVVMIDHHLQSGDRVDNVICSYIEPTASSASEMVTEIIHYLSNNVKLTKLEAEALYAGILIDTDFFTKNTEAKTFEAAAFLRKNGVDIGRVNGLFSDTLDDFKIKADIIKNAEMFEDKYAIAICPGDYGQNPTIIAAQVSNELLALSGVEASFVLTDYSGKIYISARSGSKVNVQIIMERMGGGGHMNMAGAQLEKNTINEAERKLKLTIKKMMEEGILE